MAGKKGMIGDGMGGRREGAGRPPAKVSVKPSDTFCVSQANADGRQQGMSEIWEVVSVSRSVILLRSQQTGDTIKMVR